METKRSIISILALGLLCSSCNEKQQSPPLDQQPVEVKTLALSTDNEAIRPVIYSGTVTAGKTIDLSFLVSGRLQRFPVEIGQYIKKGQLIAEVDDAVYRSQYQGQKAQATLAKENYDRTNQVFQKGSIAEIKLLEAKSQYEQAQAAVSAAQENLSYTKLYAPVSGYVGNKLAEIGNTVAPGHPVIQLLDISFLKVEVSIPETEINRIKKGSLALIRVPSLQLNDLEGVVDEVSVIAGQGVPTYKASVLLKSAGTGLKPGMVAEVSLKSALADTLERETDSTKFAPLVVPIQTVQIDEQGQQFVFVSSADGKRAERRLITTGKLYDNGIAVLSGLDAKDRLIVSGYHKLTDSTLIQLAK
ncbi:efflux RND transporter periplasmic adaptor subunit [Olivibacter sp. XZL3]|uniref:efflux RND transporter periplasmic adaptor subunit n=1 Tax=Olivibacter sp. XZL3 TaxID=1735116 RepID=UPI001417042E|nr:efflux RND transporter periplasmic adaptor subunit [Olivibacter sp. XZL3]